MIWRLKSMIRRRKRRTSDVQKQLSQLKAGQVVILQRLYALERHLREIERSLSLLSIAPPQDQKEKAQDKLRITLAVMRQQATRAQRLAAADAVIFNDVDDLDRLHALIDRLSPRFGL